MGIAGLLKLLKSITVKSHLREFTGLRVAVDAHCWLHRGAFSCAKELASGQFSIKVVTFFLSMIEMLKSNGIVDIIVVFDGGELPIKRETNALRSVEREKSLALAIAAEKEGDAASAYKYYQQSISISDEVIQNAIKALKEKGINVLVAPYEADAQLAFLSQMGQVDLVITEDSDSLVYGCKNVLFKLSKDGYGDLIQRNKLCYNSSVSFANWNDDQFKLFCCLSGCDYVFNLKSIGLKSAYKIVNKFKTFSRVADYLKASTKLSDFSQAYLQRLQQAMLTFKHQTIFNIKSGCMEHLTPLPSHFTTIEGVAQRGNSCVSFLGPILDKEVASSIASGRTNPTSLNIKDDKKFRDVACDSVSTRFKGLRSCIQGMTSKNQLQNHHQAKQKPVIHKIESEVTTKEHDENVNWSFNCDKATNEKAVVDFRTDVVPTVGPNWGFQTFSEPIMPIENKKRGRPSHLPSNINGVNAEAMPFVSNKVSNAFMTMQRRKATVHRVTDQSREATIHRAVTQKIDLTVSTPQYYEEKWNDKPNKKQMMNDSKFFEDEPLDNPVTFSKKTCVEDPFISNNHNPKHLLVKPKNFFNPSPLQFNGLLSQSHRFQPHKRVIDYKQESFFDC